IAFLSRREHSSYELKNKLLRYTDDQQAIDNVLQRLQKENWQSDQRFVENFIELKKYKWGNKRIYYELEKHQLDKNLILELQEQLLETEFDRAYQVWERKFAN